MNIKLDKDVRVRLSQQEAEVLKNKKQLAQQFSLGLQKFSIELKVEREVTKSKIINNINSIIVVLTENDATKICDQSLTQSEVVIDNIVIQVDRWSATVRVKHENHLKNHRH